MNEFLIHNGLIVSGSMSASFLYSTASHALTASFVPGPQVFGAVVSASYADSSSYALSASYARNATTAATASYVTGSAIVGPVASAISSSYAVTASFYSYYNVTQSITYVVSSSWASSSMSSSWSDNAVQAITSSYAVTSSFLNGFIYDAVSGTLATTQSNVVIMQRSTGSLFGVKYEYVARSGSNSTRGWIDCHWNGGSIQHNDNGCADIGTGATNIAFSISASGNQVQVLANNTSAPWSFKVIGIFL